MGRHQAREVALQTLYQIDVGKANHKEALKTMFEEFAVAKKDAQYASQLVEGVVEKKDHYDAIISESSAEWNLERLARIDLNILRLALYELLSKKDIPSSVVINEAIELAKTFSSAEASKFINGILDKVLKYEVN